jgi:hypothetical protein
MKTILLPIVFIALLLCSCSKDNKLIRDAERFLKSQLNDPASYKKDSLFITAKVTELQNKKEIIHYSILMNSSQITTIKGFMNDESRYFKMNTNEFEKDINKDGYEGIKELYNNILTDYNTTTKKHISEVDSLSTVLNQLRKDSIMIYSQTDNRQIQKIEFKAVYRTKNQFGALVKQISFIVYYPNKGYEIIPFE